MTYVMSDLHGCYDLYLQMLSHIGFSAEDHLYVLGDVLDRGDKSIALLTDLCSRPNATLLLGNHEWMGRYVMARPEDTDPLSERKRDHWFLNGGEVTLRQFLALSEGDRELILTYLNALPTHETLSVGDKTFVLVHAGLNPLKSLEDLWRVPEYDLVWLRPDLSQPAFPAESVFTVFGHTPTKLLTGKWEIARENRNICIDCGAAYGGHLACLRLEDLREFYL